MAKINTNAFCREMAAKSQQGIRNVIHTLLSLLEDAGVPRIPSESFRKAKFNQPEVSMSFWTMLFHVIHLAKTLDCPSSTLQSTGNTSNHQSEYIILRVRKYFFSLGYSRLHFFTDPVTSRELVLAFAWLLCKTELARKLTEHHYRAANTVRIPLRTGQRFLVETLERDIESFKEEVEQVWKETFNSSDSFNAKNELNTDQLEIALKKMAWLNGKVKCRLNSALSTQHGYQKLSHQIHHYTKQPSNGEHLTVHEVFLLRHPEQLSSYLKDLEKHLVALQRLLEWRSCEPLFWQWMESVLDLDEQEKLRETGSPEDESGEPVAKVLSREELEMRVRALERDVTMLVARNQPHIDKINRSWQMKSRSVRREDIEEELSKAHLPVTTVNHSDVQSFSNTTAALEQLRSIDIPLCLPLDTSHKLPSRRGHQLPSSLEIERTHSESLQALNVRLEQLQSELAANREKMRKAKSAVARQLEAVEQTLPPNICKLET